MKIIQYKTLRTNSIRKESPFLKYSSLREKQLSRKHAIEKYDMNLSKDDDPALSKL